jgi:hypothetical protein
MIGQLIHQNTEWCSVLVDCRIKTRTNNISEKVEYTKGVIRSRRSRDRQYNGHKKKDKRKK